MYIKPHAPEQPMDQRTNQTVIKSILRQLWMVWLTGLECHPVDGKVAGSVPG